LDERQRFGSRPCKIKRIPLIAEGALCVVDGVTIDPDILDHLLTSTRFSHRGERRLCFGRKAIDKPVGWKWERQKLIVSRSTMSKLPDFEGLAIFAKVLQMQSFVRTTSELQLSKAAVSKAITRSET
jgi:hypothetical protein